MKFCELSRDVYQNFQKHHIYRCFLNSVEMMDLEVLQDLQVEYVGVMQDEHVIAATALVKMPTMKRFFYYYSPRGILVDFQNKEIVNFFLSELKKFCRKSKAMYLVVDPNVLYRERNQDGELVEDGFNHQCIIDQLTKNQFKHQGFSVGYGQNMQYIRFTFVKSLVNQSIDDVWKNLHQQTRWSINKTLKYNVMVRELQRDELSIFHDIIEKTSIRRNFSNRSLSFYENQMDAFHGQIKVYLAYLDVDGYVARLHQDINENTMEKKQTEMMVAQNGKSKKLVKRLQVIDEALVIAEQRLNEALQLQDEYGSIIHLAASMFVFQGDEVTYLTSGAYETFKKYYAPYAIQWHVMQEAIARGCTTYNFYGISGAFDEGDDNYGVYAFKRGFGGHVEEYIGDFIYSSRPILHTIFRTLKKSTAFMKRA